MNQRLMEVLVCLDLRWYGYGYISNLVGSAILDVWPIFGTSVKLIGFEIRR